MRTAGEDMKQEDLGRSFFPAPDSGFAFMSNNFKMYKSINDSWVDFLRKSVKETKGEHGGENSPWLKAMESWQQFPAQVLRHGISSAAVMKEVMQYCAGGQKTYADLGVACLNSLQKMSQAFREARENGNGASDAWKCCFEASEELARAEMSFAEERVSDLYRLWSVIVQRNAAAENRESGKTKEGKTSRT